MVELHQLDYFVAVAEELSFTRGARRVHVVQSAVSAAIARLEREFGMELFHRSGRRIELTEAGRTLLARARVVLADARGVRDDMDALRGGVRGTVTVGTLLSTGSLDLAARLKGFHSRHPAVSVRLRHSPGDTANHVAQVLDGGFDLALIIAPGVEPPGVLIDPIGSISLRLACSALHPLASATDVEYRDVADETFIDFPPGWGTRVVADSMFAEAGCDRAVAIEVTDVASALDLVAGGLGVAFVPERSIDGREDITTVDLSHQPAHSTLSLATSARRARSAATEALRRTLINAAPPAAATNLRRVRR